MKDIKCPYCKHEFNICHDDGFGYEEGTPHQQECPECEKTFIFYTYISFSYSPSKADCLNGAEHDYKKTSTYPPKFSRMRCKVCEHEIASTTDRNE